MATIPSFTDVTTVVHDTDLNFMLVVPQGGVNQLTPQAALANATTTVVNWDTKAFDTDTSMWTISTPSRLTLNTLGTFLFTVNLRWASNATGYRFLDLRKNAFGNPANGVSIASVSSPAVNGNTTNQALSVQWDGFVAGDVVELFAFQNSGGTLAFSTGAIWGCAVMTACWTGSS